MERESPVCKRCYRIRHYGEFSRVVVSPHEYANQVSRILDEPGLVLYVLDVFDLQGSMVTGLSRYIGGAPVVAVVNKVDLLPSEVHYDALETWVTRELSASGVVPERVQFVSADTGEGVDRLLEFIQRRPESRVYVVGMANVGKSTLLNRVVSSQSGSRPFTVSRVPGTTLGLTGVVLETGSGHSVQLIDTPGLIHGYRVTDHLCGDCLKATVPQTRLRPRVYQLNPGQSLWIGGYARIDFVQGSHQPIVCYVSNELVVHRTKLERADIIGREHADDILKVPCAKCRTALGEFTMYRLSAGQTAGAGKRTNELKIGPRGADVVLAGLGWISLFGQPYHGTLLLPRVIDVTLRPRLIGGLASRPRLVSRVVRGGSK